MTELRLRELYLRYAELSEYTDRNCDRHQEFERCEVCGENGEYAKAKRAYEAAAVCYVDELMWAQDATDEHLAEIECQPK